MEKIKVAIVGYGNIGRYALEAVEVAPDMECVGLVRRNGSAEGYPELVSYKVVSDISELGKVDVAILSTPSRKVRENAEKYLSKGISTVDSFDIHSDIAALRSALAPVAKASGAVSIISAGWDPGSDSVIRALVRALVPGGKTYTNFGPGRSMGHTVVVKSKPGVADALSLTLPAGFGKHDRLVYVVLEKGADFSAVRESIVTDPYFSSDKTEVREVPSIEPYDSMMHGVNIVRDGMSGRTDKQHIDFNMRINNPALTGQMLVGAARAATRQAPGCYTMIEIPPVDFLAGTREELIPEIV
ncbi:MAG: diaminopimelate dehydrogenase [Bacteroidales bacterium]|nr:diaminopimelate dehydrogenase [Bacteroidales bacterium]